MNNLPDDVLDRIYYYRHQMEYVKVMEQLLQAKINVYYNFSLAQCRVTFFVKNNIKYLTLDVSNISVSSKQLLNVIKNYKKVI
jgi:hypothetical protein